MHSIFTGCGEGSFNACCQPIDNPMQVSPADPAHTVNPFKTFLYVRSSVEKGARKGLVHIDIYPVHLLTVFESHNTAAVVKFRIPVPCLSGCCVLSMLGALLAFEPSSPCLLLPGAQFLALLVERPQNGLFCLIDSAVCCFC